MIESKPVPLGLRMGVEMEREGSPEHVGVMTILYFFLRRHLHTFTFAFADLYTLDGMSMIAQ